MVISILLAKEENYSINQLKVFPKKDKKSIKKKGSQIATY